jgi:hypothetical protein
MHKTCKIKFAVASEKIFELAENTWAVYSTGTINTNQVCQANNMIHTRQIKSGDTIKIDPGCYIRTMDHVILTDESEMIEIQKKTTDWTRELTELFGRSNTEGILMAIQGLRTKYNSKFDARELFKEFNQIKPADAHWKFTLPATMIGITLAIFLTGMLILKHEPTKTKPHTESIGTPDADSKSPTVTHREAGDLQPGHQIKFAHPYPH